MRRIVGLDRPDSGTVTVNGQAYRDLRFLLPQVGALLEAKAVHPGRSARGAPRGSDRANSRVRAMWRPAEPGAGT